MSGINPARIQTREDLAGQLEALFQRDPRSIQRLAQDARLGPATLHGMINGTSLPRKGTLEAFVKECHEDPRPWLDARARVLRGDRQGARHSAAGPSRELRARGFWRDLFEPDLTIVVSVFGLMDEPSGLMGAGCAFGLIELLRHLGELGTRQPRIVTTADGGQVTDDSLRNTLILLGGPARNAVTRDAMSRLPLTHHFTESLTTILDTLTGRAYGYSPALFGQADGTDYGLLVKATNPFNPQASILIIAGSSGYGTWAGTRLITESSALDETAASGDPFECIFATDVLGRSPQATEALVIRRLSNKQHKLGTFADSP